MALKSYTTLLSTKISTVSSDLERIQQQRRVLEDRLAAARVEKQRREAAELLAKQEKELEERKEQDRQRILTYKKNQLDLYKKTREIERQEENYSMFLVQKAKDDYDRQQEKNKEAEVKKMWADRNKELALEKQKRQEMQKVEELEKQLAQLLA